MEDRKMQVISELMEELQELMQPDESDLSERLGREKPPGIEVMKLEGSVEPSLEEDQEGADLEEDEEMLEESPEDKLKSRLLKLRGA